MIILIAILSFISIFLIYTYFIKKYITKENFQQGQGTWSLVPPALMLDGFMLGNEEFCRSKGIDPCENYNYNSQNVEECRTKGFEICKRDKELGDNSMFSYLANNPAECRKNGVEPCTDERYRYYNGPECRTKGFEPCEDKSYRYYKYDECKIINNKYAIEPCKNIDYQKNMNPDYCKSKGVNICENEFYRWNTLGWCKNNFDLCTDDEYVLRNFAECKNKNPNKDYCRLTSGYGYFPYANACPDECIRKNPDWCNTNPDIAYNNKELCKQLNPGKDYSNSQSVEELVAKGIM